MIIFMLIMVTRETSLFPAVMLAPSRLHYVSFCLMRQWACSLSLWVLFLPFLEMWNGGMGYGNWELVVVIGCYYAFCLFGLSLGSPLNSSECVVHVSIDCGCFVSPSIGPILTQLLLCHIILCTLNLCNNITMYTVVKLLQQSATRVCMIASWLAS